MNFIGHFIEEAIELDEVYQVRLAHEGPYNDIIILCSIFKSVITKKELEQYVIDKQRVGLHSVVLQNTIVERGSSKEAELHIGVHRIECLNERYRRLRELIDTYTTEEAK